MTESQLTDSTYKDTHLLHNLEENHFDRPYEAPFKYNTSTLSWNIRPLFPPPLKGNILRLRSSSEIMNWFDQILSVAAYASFRSSWNFFFLSCSTGVSLSRSDRHSISCCNSMQAEDPCHPKACQNQWKSKHIGLTKKKLRGRSLYGMWLHILSEPLHTQLSVLQILHHPKKRQDTWKLFHQLTMEPLARNPSKWAQDQPEWVKTD